MTAHRSVVLDQITLESPPSTRVSKNFSLYELTASDTADRLSIDNDFTDVEHLQNALYLCEKILQPIRDKFGSYSPNSVYRNQTLERALKRKPADWISHSQHTLGQAADIEIAGLTTMELASWIEKHLDYDQLILECYNPAKGPNSGWVHVSTKRPEVGENRAQALSYIRDTASDRFVYVNGLTATV